MNLEAQSYDLSMSAALEALAKKQSLVPLLRTLFAAQRSPANTAMIFGVSNCMVLVLDAAQAANIKFKMRTPEAQEIVDAAPTARRLHMSGRVVKIDQAGGEILWEIAHAIQAIADRLSVGDAERAATTKSKEPETADSQ